MDAIYVGIDVSKDRLDVAIRPDGESFVVPRSGAGIDELIARLKSLSIKLVAVEATGGFETVVAAGMAGAGLPVVVVNPAQVRAFAQALGKRAKTDPIDAAVIAHLPKPPDRNFGHSPTPQRSCSPIWSPAGVRSWR
jgi:transposase